MKLSSMPTLAKLALACGVFTDVALAMSRHQVHNFRNGISRAAPPAAPGDAALTASTIFNSTFEQLIDHKNPHLGTFSQFYYYSTEFYKGPGSPVVFFTPGEIAVTGYQSYTTTNRTTGVIAQEIGAAVIVLEHRYWGFSSPFAELTTENLQYQTLENAIADLNHFALTAKLPFDTTGKTNADKAPWVLVGGSYSGALTAWTESTTKPSVMWAYYASSAVVETIGNYWSYFLPETENMPKNCSTDITRVVEYLDNIGETGTPKEQTAAKALFGLEGVSHYDDFMDALANGPYLWQGNQFYENTGFFDFCDAVEGVDSNSTSLPGANGVGLKKALAGYASWFTTELLPGYCESFGYPEFAGTLNVLCFDTYNSSLPTYSDISVDNAYDRQWDYFLCSGFGWWQNGAPKGQQTIVSRLVQNPYWTRQCAEWFPTVDGHTYPLNAGATYNTANLYTGGWFGFEFSSTRLIFVSGTNDPWRTSQVVSPLRPGGPQPSLPGRPVLDVPGGYHTSDLVTANGVANAGCAKVQAQVVSQVKEWVGEYPGKKWPWKE
ncbi:putative extracellular serine carboxypeptidase [Hyphodiscus hymeniophilus]|uniref:Extracellular serine carboxypeptidase n=1 Tax=Hyphodiscus hymeniophilus TaxID=353542 RepID=A0A9P7AV34_9HELO|nr:putative extracellular serine carboxypeptidase [Hyphodiscus hymeniophilus]